LRAKARVRYFKSKKMSGNNKRTAHGTFDLNGTVQKVARLDEATASAGHYTTSKRNNPYLAHPVQPQLALSQFLTQCRTAARNYLPKETLPEIITVPFCEVEVRLGILNVPHASPDRRVTSTGAKHVQGQLARAFDCR
jgi:hypothetical protein